MTEAKRAHLELVWAVAEEVLPKISPRTPGSLVELGLQRVTELPALPRGDLPGTLRAQGVVWPTTRAERLEWRIRMARQAFGRILDALFQD